MKQELNSSLYW